MKLLIDISEYNAEYIRNTYRVPQDINMVIAEAIINGKQISTPHGRLIDADKLNIHDISPVDGFCVMGVTEEDIELADTVIEAEGSEE